MLLKLAVLCPALAEDEMRKRLQGGRVNRESIHLQPWHVLKNRKCPYFS